MVRGLAAHGVDVEHVVAHTARIERVRVGREVVRHVRVGARVGGDVRDARAILVGEDEHLGIGVLDDGERLVVARGPAGREPVLHAVPDR